MNECVFTLRQAETVFAKLHVEEGSSNHHRRGYLIDCVTGKRLFPALHFNKGRGEMYPAIAKKFRLALRLKEEEFTVLMRCTMKREEYFEIRRSRDG